MAAALLSAIELDRGADQSLNRRIPQARPLPLRRVNATNWSVTRLARHSPAVQQVSTPPKPLIMIDPAHGGSESGAVLNPAILEKDITLALARRLRSDLGARGFVAELMRDSDVNLSTDDRASKANSAHPALYVCLHATSEPAGVGIYTSMLADSGQSEGPFVDWDTAQFPFLAASRLAQQEIAAAIQKSGMPVRSLMAPLRPLAKPHESGGGCGIRTH